MTLISRTDAGVQSMTLLVPMDGSAIAQQALSHALRIVEGRQNSIIVLVNVQNCQTLGLSDIDADEPTELEIRAHQAASAAFREAAWACKKAGVLVETQVAFGPICETIVRIAREVDADQIIMGTRGLGRFGGFLFGSVAAGVVHLADVPVTLVNGRVSPRARNTAMRRHDDIWNFSRETTSCSQLAQCRGGSSRHRGYPPPEFADTPTYATRSEPGRPPARGGDGNRRQLRACAMVAGSVT